MRHRTMMISGVPAVRVYLSYEEAQDFLALDEERLGVLEALAESAGTAKARVRLDLYPIDQIAESAIEGEEECDEDYVEALYSLEGIDRPGLLKILDRAARIVAREIRAWDTQEIGVLVGLLMALDDLIGHAGADQGWCREDFVRMESLPSATPVPYDLIGYPVWAVDQQGMALVGEEADDVEEVEEVRAHMEKSARRAPRRTPDVGGIPVRCHKCGYAWLYQGKSSYRTTCPSCSVTVYLQKSEIPRAELVRARSQ